MRQVDEMRREALRRARTGTSASNDALVIETFAQKGMAAVPRENVFTYQAWLALGRQVKKGEHGVRIPTIIERLDEETDETRRIRKMAVVFHIDQTKLKEERNGKERGSRADHLRSEDPEGVAETVDG